MRVEIIGIAGKAGSGKDTVANHLVAKYGFQQMTYADPIKEAVFARFGWMPDWWNARTWRESSQPEALDKSPRDWVQWFGRTVQLLDPEFWINMLERVLDKRIRKHLQEGTGKTLRIVVSDVRYDAEAFRLRVYRFRAPLLGLPTHAVRTRIIQLDSEQTVLPAEQAAHESEAGVHEKYVDLRIRESDLMTTLQSVDASVAEWGMV